MLRYATICLAVAIIIFIIIVAFSLLASGAGHILRIIGFVALALAIIFFILEFVKRKMKAKP